MTASWTWLPLAAFAVLGPCIASCSGAASSSPGVGGADTGSSASGGGEGGAGGGVDAGPSCGDCSTIVTPQCFTAVCDEKKGECAIIPTEGGEPCDDGMFCTVGETCKNGVCGQGSDNLCGMQADTCRAVVCEEAQKACALSPVPDGTSCVSDDLCTVNAVCEGGACKGAAKDCFFAPVPDNCHVSVCNAQTGVCEPVPGNDGDACEAGDQCMLNKKCLAGACGGGQPKSCAALDAPCKVGVCDPMTGQCSAQPFGVGDACQEATDDCNKGLCSAVGTCDPMPVNEGGSCSDGDPCTTGETCASGACTGGVLNNHIVYFSEPFADNSQGWTFNQPNNPASQEWGIGPAMASACQNSGGSDPADDHTPTEDNGVAGVAVGGCPVKGIHPYYYLESPAINADVAGEVWLEAWRFLNSDYKPYMTNSIEVWSGAAWVKVWESQGFPPIKDTQWTRVAYDLTPWKSASMRVRFGFAVQNTLGFVVSSWNLDDVVIANNVCK